MTNSHGFTEQKTHKETQNQCMKITCSNKFFLTMIKENSRYLVEYKGWPIRM